MERKTKRSFWSRLTFQHEIKIGIAKDAKSRNRAINAAIKGDIKILVCRRVMFAEAVEKKKLHLMFSDSRFKMKGIKGKRGGGLTEWFFLTSTELFLLRCWLFWYAVRHWFYLSALLTASAFFVYLKYFAQ